MWLGTRHSPSPRDRRERSAHASRPPSQAIGQAKGDQDQPEKHHDHERHDPLSTRAPIPIRGATFCPGIGLTARTDRGLAP
jgi:hypothetical protein